MRSAAARAACSAASLQPLGFGRLALGHITHDCRDEETLLRRQGTQADLGRELAAVAPATGEIEPQPHRPRAGIGREDAAVLPVPLAERRRQERLDGQADELLARIPEERLRLLVDQRDTALGIGDHDGIRSRLQQAAEARLAGADDVALLLGPPGSADEGQDARHQGREDEGGGDRGDRGHDLHGPREPVAGLPQRPHLHEVRRSAGDDERAEGEEHRLEGDLAPAAMDQEDQRGRDAEVGQADDDVGHGVKGEQAPIPEIADGNGGGSSARHRMPSPEPSPPPRRSLPRHISKSLRIPPPPWLLSISPRVMPGGQREAHAGRELRGGRSAMTAPARTARRDGRPRRRLR